MINYNSLCIELTRRCNMSCVHCMRGEAENKNISSKVISHALNNVCRIDELTFSGGEPTLNVPAMVEILKVCKARHISVGNFYVVTNGKIVPDKFLMACIQWWMYCDNNEYSGVSLSRDMFHEDIPEEHIKKLSALQFFFKDDHVFDWDRGSLLNLGRAKNLSRSKRNPNYICNVEVLPGESTKDICVDSTITVTVDGDIIPVCDYSYEDVSVIKVGTVFDHPFK